MKYSPPLVSLLLLVVPLGASAAPKCTLTRASPSFEAEALASAKEGLLKSARISDANKCSPSQAVRQFIEKRTSRVLNVSSLESELDAQIKTTEVFFMRKGNEKIMLGQDASIGGAALSGAFKKLAEKNCDMKIGSSNKQQLIITTSTGGPLATVKEARGTIRHEMVHLLAGRLGESSAFHHHMLTRYLDGQEGRGFSCDAKKASGREEDQASEDDDSWAGEDQAGEDEIVEAQESAEASEASEASEDE